MTPQILIATTNPGKMKEIRALLEGAPVRFFSLSDFPPVPEPDETETTFSGNARLKAQAYAQAIGMPTVAEDSGLVIDALGGDPGVQSARYPGATYPDKFAHLYARLAAHPQPWTARYICWLAFVDQEGRLLFETEGRVEGEIAREPRGEHGFGYDPIFYYPPYGQTLGETEDERKLAIAHRGVAFRAFKDWLLTRV